MTPLAQSLVVVLLVHFQQVQNPMPTRACLNLLDHSTLTTLESSEGMGEDMS